MQSPLVLLLVFAIAAPLLLEACSPSTTTPKMPGYRKRRSASPDAIHAQILMNTPFENEEQAKGVAGYLESQLGLASSFLNVNADDLKEAERVIENENGSVKITYDLEKKGGCQNAHTIGDLGVAYLSEIEQIDVVCDGSEKQYKR
ncbi:hypothetical protein L596_028735 [Steinernema carpocapsae]|uniref:Uncharacterized protein n=1 Tax=Steinernema carpocapsae TaxID=34508 RepID=A0A4U5LZ94_STECR|nr:hypothetical protein L596_028735 [Steinernema carpocapsae]